MASHLSIAPLPIEGKEELKALLVTFADASPLEVADFTAIAQALNEAKADLLCVTGSSCKLLNKVRRAVRLLAAGQHVSLVQFKGAGFVLTSAAWRELSPHLGAPCSWDEAGNRLSALAQKLRTFASMEFPEDVDFAFAEEKIKSVPVPTQAPRVLVFAPYGAWTVHEQVSAVLGAAMRVRGAEVLVVGCDGSYRDSCYILVNSACAGQDCANCAAMGPKFFGAFGLTHHPIRRYMKPSDHDEVLKWVAALNPNEYAKAEFDQQPIGRWLTPIICSYFKISPARLHLAPVKEVFKKYLVYAAETYRAAKILFEEFRPTSVVMFSGGGMAHSSVIELAISRSVPVLAHTLGRCPGGFMFSQNEMTSAFRSRFEVASIWGDIPLVPEEFSLIQKYLRERQQGINHNFSSYHEEATDHANVRQRLNIPAGAKVFGAFTSSEYEKVYYPEYDNTPSQIEILRTLIDLFRGREEYLVIRHHPQIGGGDVEDADTEFVTGAYELARDLPPNVRVIMPHEKISSYSLLWNIDAAFAPFTTVALESVSMGIPTAASSLSPYSAGISFTIDGFDRTTLDNMICMLLGKEGEFTTAHLTKLYRFMHAFTYKHSQMLQACSVGPGATTDIRINSTDQLKPGIDPVLDRLCNFLSQAASIYESPSAEHRARPVDVEEALITAEATRVQEFRRQLRASVVSNPAEIQTRASLEVFGLSYVDIDDCKSQNQHWQEHQRGRQFAYRRIPVRAGSDFRYTYQQIARAAAASTSEYILVTNDYVQYDEAFVSLSHELIEKHNRPAALLWGTWLQTKGLGIDRMAFTKRHPVQTFELVEKYFGSLELPEQLLACAWVSRERLVSECEQIARSVTRADAIKKTFDLVAGDGVARADIPMLVLHAVQFSNQQEKNFGALGATFVADNSSETIITGTELAAFDPRNSVRMLNVAIEYIKHGSNTEALSLIKLAAPHFPADPVVYFLKSVAEFRLGDWEAARDSATELLNRDPNHADGKMILMESIKQISNKPGAV